MNLRSLALAATLATAFVAPAQAALITLSGTSFDLTYDTTKLGLFGTPSLVGNTIQFSPNSFFAQSLGGSGAVPKNSTVTGLVLTAKNGVQFESFSLAEFGDYTLTGAGSFVRVQGQLRAFDQASALDTQTSSNLIVSPSTPLNLNDGLNHDWTATALINSSTAAVAGSTNVILSNPDAVVLTIENRLLAFTSSSTVGFTEAFIEKKFAGVELHVSVVPVPPALWMFGAGLIAVAGFVRRSRG